MPKRKLFLSRVFFLFFVKRLFRKYFILYFIQDVFQGAPTGPWLSKYPSRVWLLAVSSPLAKYPKSLLRQPFTKKNSSVIDYCYHSIFLASFPSLPPSLRVQENSVVFFLIQSISVDLSPFSLKFSRCLYNPSMEFTVYFCRITFLLPQNPWWDYLAFTAITCVFSSGLITFHFIEDKWSWISTDSFSVLPVLYHDFLGKIARNGVGDFIGKL